MLSNLSYTGSVSKQTKLILALTMQVRLKREHRNIAAFEPENGLDPMLDLALVGSEWQIIIQSRASKWQDNLVVMSTRSVERGALSPTEVIV